MRIYLIGFIFLWLSLEGISQKTIHVPDDYTTIQEALDEAIEFDTVLVGPGTYFENLVWPSGKNLHLIGEEGRDSTIIDGGGLDRVMHIEYLKPSSMLSGFTIQNGMLMEKKYGAGIYALYSNFELKNLIISNNNISNEGDAKGSGIYLYSFKGRLDSCEIKYNTANTDGVIGIGTYINPIGDVVISNCNFINNDGISNAQGSNMNGGGLGIQASFNLSISPLILLSQCQFSENLVNGNNSAGAGLYVRTTGSQIELRIDSCHFTKNVTKHKFVGKGIGGAISIKGDIHTHLMNSVIESNIANSGSGLYSGLWSNSNSTIVSSTIFVNNETISGLVDPAVIFLQSNNEVLIANSEISFNQGNSIIANQTSIINGPQKISIINSTIVNNDLPIRIKNRELFISQSILKNDSPTEIEQEVDTIGSIKVHHSLVEGGYPGEGNINGDPLFISEDILIPTENSPCINAGDSSLNVSTDLLGNPRPMPSGTNPDIGAYEVNQPVVSSTVGQTPNRLKVFPNPTQDWIYFSEKIDLVKIYNETGLLIISKWDVDTIDVSTLMGGVYTIHMQEGKTTQLESLVIINK